MFTEPRVHEPWFYYSAQERNVPIHISHFKNRPNLSTLINDHFGDVYKQSFGNFDKRSFDNADKHLFGNIGKRYFAGVLNDNL